MLVSFLCRRAIVAVVIVEAAHAKEFHGQEDNGYLDRQVNGVKDGLRLGKFVTHCVGIYTRIVITAHICLSELLDAFLVGLALFTLLVNDHEHARETGEEKQASDEGLIL